MCTGIFRPALFLVEVDRFFDRRAQHVRTHNKEERILLGKGELVLNELRQLRFR